MSWFPVLDLAAQYWQGKRALPRDYDVLDRLRKAISDLPPDDVDAPEDSPETLSQEASEAGAEKQTWNVDEDRRLKKLAKTYDYDWEEVAVHMPRRSPIACKKRWEKKQRRTAASQPWQEQEDELLLALHSKLGPDWKEISERLPGRTPDSIQLRLQTLDRNAKPASQSTLTGTADDSLAKERQIEFLRQNAQRLEEKIRMYKDELGRLEMDLDASLL